jgi:putative two-component system response regulator
MKSILVTDDNLATLKQIGEQLRSNYEVFLAKSGPMALQIAEQEKPDLILLDVEMPEMNGFQTIAKLKESPSLREIPVIFLTGDTDAATEIKALESGAVDFITKPANTSILYHRMEIHLQLSAYQLSLEHTVKELEDNIGFSFAELIECKDENIAGHVLRTGKYVELLSRTLFDAGTFGSDFNSDDIDLITRAAPFHDIGKIGVSDKILLKRGPLDPEEYAEVKKHTVIGAQVLQLVFERTPTQKYLSFARIIAEGHHERFDGRGYPKGLSGNDIPLCCRILAVVNVYDACMTDRVYRKALDHKAALDIIIQGKGLAFDSRIVDVFNSISDKFAVMSEELHFIDGGIGRILHYE